MVILDTSVIIDHLRQSPKVSVLIKLFEKYKNEHLCVSVITLQELYEGKSTRDKIKENYLLSTLGLFDLLPYNSEVAELAGKIARDRKNSIDFADAAIAATTIIFGGELYTLNLKHFEGVPNLVLFKN